MASQMAVVIDADVFCSAPFFSGRYVQFPSAGYESSPGEKFLKRCLHDRCQGRRNLLLPDKGIQVRLDFVGNGHRGAPHNPHSNTNFTKW